MTNDTDWPEGLDHAEASCDPGPMVLRPLAHSQAIAAECRAADPDWRYETVNLSGDGRATAVIVYDEEGYKLGFI